MTEVVQIISRIGELNPFVIATATASLYFVVFTLLKYFISKEFDWITATVGTVVIWAVYFAVQALINWVARKKQGKGK